MLKLRSPAPDAGGAVGGEVSLVGWGGVGPGGGEKMGNMIIGSVGRWGLH